MLRALRATGVVAAVGAAAGVLGGMLVAALIGAMMLADKAPSEGPGLGEIGFILGVSSLFGAAFGLVLGPLLGWTLMRRVPLGRAVGETAFAAAVGVGVSFMAPLGPFAIFFYPVIAATLAALRLRFAYRALPATGRLTTERPDVRPITENRRVDQ